MTTPIYVCPGKCCMDFSGYAIQPTYPVVNPVILALVGEAPGEAEVKTYKFFMGRAGQELTNYLIRVGIPRDRCYLTNLIKCRPPDNRDPTQSEIRACSSILLQELEYVNPRFIATVGRHATQFFLGDVNMEAVHGIPHRVGDRIVIPVYHPAAGLHDTFNMSNIMADFIAVKDTMMGKLEIREVGKVVTPPPYHLIEKGEDPSPYLSDLVAIDTETQDDQDTPWCLQFCCGDQGHIIMWDNHYALSRFGSHIAKGGVTSIIHNSLFDLKVLDYMHLYPSKFVDTMIMAYLLQTEPQGLKPLTFRHLRVKMDEYTDIVNPRTQDMAIDYILRAGQYTWPKLDPVLEMKSGVPKLRQPQTVNQKVKRILNDLAAGKEVDVFDRWHKMPLEEGRSMVDEVIGTMKRAYLKDVDQDVAFQYAATDPWATYFIYPVLKAKIDALGLQEVLDRDNGVVPMVEAMQRNGMPINPSHFLHLREQFTSEMDSVTSQVESMVGPMNPGSDPQVLALLERLNIVHAPRKIVKGKEVVVGKKMTDIKAMELIKDRHPVIPLIMRYRALDKLVDSFIDVLLARKGEDNRIRTTLRVTRVITGRLSSSKPNLMAMPTRTEDGRRIREGFVARPGYSFLSNDYCLSPETKVLTYDLKWVTVGSLKVGDMLWGVDEDRPCKGGYRHMHLSIVEGLKKRKAPSCLLTTNDGKHIICSEDHRWYARKVNGGSYSLAGYKNNGSYGWVKTKDLSNKWEIWNASEVWDTDTTWKGGYLAGAFDGEGSISVGRGIILTFVQKAGLMLTTVEKLLREQGYQFHKPYGKIGGFKNSKEVMSIWISNRRDIARFLGTNRPIRLLEKAQSLFEGRRPPQSSSVVDQVIPLGECEVVSVQTSTKTLIAEGLISHNSQVEMRVIAHISEDPAMLKVFRTGVDLHTATAAGMFEIPPEEVDEMLHRYPAKRVGFGVLNLISAGKLLQEFQVGGAVGWTEPRCQKVIDDWFKLYYKVAEYVKERKAEARRTGMVRDMFGRVRLIPEIISVHRNIREAGIRQAVNGPIQMGAQGVIKEAMRQLHPILKDVGEDTIIPLIQIHDDLVFECKTDSIPVMIPIIQGVMENCVELRVPLKVDSKYGPSWSNMTKWKG